MIDKTLNKVNSKQKKLFLVLVPIVFFIIFFPIAEEYSRGSLDILKLDFELEEVWWVWLGYIAVVGYLEFKILSKLD